MPKAMKDAIKNNRGIGLLEVVIASAIMAVVLLVTTNMIFNGQQGAQSVQKRLNSVELQSFLTQTLTVPAACNVSGLIGQPAPVAGVSVPTLTFATVKMDDSTNNLFDNGQIKIASLKYKSVTISGSIYTADIQLQVNAQGSGTQTIVGGNTLAPVDFPLVVTVAGGVITECGASTTVYMKTVPGGVSQIVYCNSPQDIAVGGGFDSAGSWTRSYIFPVTNPPGGTGAPNGYHFYAETPADMGPIWLTCMHQ